MAMKRDAGVQNDLLATWADMPRSPGHAFYDRLNKLLSNSIRHFGFMANGQRAEKIARCRELIGAQSVSEKPADHAPTPPATELGASCCRECGGRLRVIEVFAAPRSRTPAWRCDTS